MSSSFPMPRVFADTPLMRGISSVSMEFRACRHIFTSWLGFM